MISADKRQSLLPYIAITSFLFVAGISGFAMFSNSSKTYLSHINDGLKENNDYTLNEESNEESNGKTENRYAVSQTRAYPVQSTEVEKPNHLNNSKTSESLNSSITKLEKLLSQSQQMLDARNSEKKQLLTILQKQKEFNALATKHLEEEKIYNTQKIQTGAGTLLPYDTSNEEISTEKTAPVITYDGTIPAEETTNINAWVPVNAPITSTTQSRSVANYDNVLNQFAVGANPRYEKRNENTYCNIFVWDATRAMGAEVPHWVDDKGNPVGVGEGRELNANATNNWFHNYGESFGWRLATAEEAQSNANEGHPSVVSWKNLDGGIGHIGMIRPGHIDETKGPALAQAGAINFNNGFVGDGFGSRKVEYWIHE